MTPGYEHRHAARACPGQPLLWDSYAARPPRASISYKQSAIFHPERDRVPPRPFSSRIRPPVMLDAIFLALGVAGFAVCLGYVYLCERL